MKRIRLISLSAAILAASLTVPAQNSVVPSASDQKGIDATLAAFGSTLTAKDFDTFAKLFTDDADFVNIVGMHWHGKAQIVKAHRVVFTTRYNGNPQHTVEKTEALLAPDVVLVVAKLQMDDYIDRNGKPMKDNFFRMTMVLQKQHGTWLIRSAENTVIDQMAAPHDPGQ